MMLAATIRKLREDGYQEIRGGERCFDCGKVIHIAVKGKNEYKFNEDGSRHPSLCHAQQIIPKDTTHD